MYRSLLILMPLFLGAGSCLRATQLNFTDPGGNDTTQTTTFDQSLLADLSLGHTVNFPSVAEAFDTFNNGNSIVWTFDNQTSLPYDDTSQSNLGSFSHNLGTLTYTKAGRFGGLLTAYSNDLDISLVDSEGTMRFTTPGSSYTNISDHVLAGRGNPNGTQTLTLTFSENVETVGLSLAVTHRFTGTVYDQAVGGTEIGTFDFSGGNRNLIWSAAEAGIPQGIGRVVLARDPTDTGGDYRILQVGFTPLSVPEPSSLLLIGLGCMLAGPRALRLFRDR